MTVVECYLRFRHLDKVLSDAKLLGESPMSKTLYVFWQVIKTNVPKYEAVESTERGYQQKR